MPKNDPPRPPTHRLARRRSGRVRVGLSLLILIAILSLGIAANRKNLNAGLNTPIRYDDFVFTVTSAGPMDSPGPAGRPAQSTGEYHVTLLIKNQAKRVDFRFRDEDAVLIGPDGRTYELVTTPTAGASPRPVRPIPAGGSDTRHLVYRVPADLRAPRLRIMPGGRSGDIIETVVAGRKQFVLP